jgi:transcription antitermination factor NusG
VRDRFAAIGVEPLLPLTRILSQWSDRKVWTTQPLFSGYCFARFALDDRLPILQTPGVVHIIGSVNPEPIPEDELAAIKAVSDSARHTEPCEYLVTGTWVEVIRGPLAGIRGELVRTAQHDGLVIRARLIQQAAMVHIDRSEVVPVDEFRRDRSAA